MSKFINIFLLASIPFAVISQAAAPQISNFENFDIIFIIVGIFMFYILFKNRLRAKSLLGIILFSIVIVVGYYTVFEYELTSVNGQKESSYINENDINSTKGNNTIEWLYGEWITHLKDGYEMKIILNRDNSINSYIDGYLFANGNFQVLDNVLLASFEGSATNSRFKINVGNKTIMTADGHIMKKRNESIIRREQSSGVKFTTSADVLSYLAHKTFVHENLQLTVKNQALYVNSQPLTNALSVIEVKHPKAIIKGWSPLVNGYATFTVDCDKGIITDMNSGDIYYYH